MIVIVQRVVVVCACVRREVIKLAAQFVARNGKHFYLGLLNREQRNPQFDFLKPQHYLHRFFNTLVDAYTKVLMPPHDLNTKLDALLDKHKIYEGLLDRVDWEKHQQRLKDEENEEEKERMERALIDWHDFVVVETITFDDDEMKPPAGRAGAAQAGGGAERAAVKLEKQDAGDDMDMDVEMEMDLDDQEIRIVKGEAPKPTPSVGTSEALKYSICPKCGEKIPLEDMEEHMRIELLDPIARQKKLEQMKRRRESSLAEGDEISKNLRNLSALRPDIFDEEEEARKAEENRRQQPKIIWDGHTGSIAATASAVMAGMTPEEKARAIAKAEADRGPKIGPAVSTTQPAAPGPVPGQQPPGQPLLPSPAQLPPGAGAPGQPPRPLGMPPGMPGMPPGMPPMGMPRPLFHDTFTVLLVAIFSCCLLRLSHLISLSAPSRRDAAGYAAWHDALRDARNASHARYGPARHAAPHAGNAAVWHAASGLRRSRARTGTFDAFLSSSRRVWSSLLLTRR